MVAMMKVRCRALLVALAWLGAASAGLARGAPSGGQPPLPTDLNGALSRTIGSGLPTVVIATSRSSPESLTLRDELATLLSRWQGRSLQFVELSAEHDPDRVRQLKVRQYPSVMVYTRSGSALALAGHRTGPMSASEVMEWIGEPSEVAEATAPRDPAVVAAGFLGHGDHHRPLPSPQVHPTPQQPPLPPPPVKAPPSKAPPAPPQQAPPQQAPPQQAPPQQAPPQMGVPSQPMSPVIMQQAAPPVVVQQPSQAVYVQQSAPKIYLGLAPPPEIVVVQGPQQAPTVSLGIVNAPSQPQAGVPNLFMPPNPPQAGPPQQGLPPQQGQPPLQGFPTPQQGMPSPQQPFASPPAMSPPAMSPPQSSPPQQGLPMAGPSMGTPMMATPMMGAPMMGTPMMAGAAPQQSIVGTTAVALLLENPGIIGRALQVLGDALSALGDRLASQGSPRIRLPRQRAMAAPSAGLAMAPLTSLQPAMLAIPQQSLFGMTAPQPQFEAKPEYLAVPVPSSGVTPSPQGPPPSPYHWGTSGKKHRFFRFFQD